MNRIVIRKIKNALKSKQPIDSINELVREYEELISLSEWRNKTILNGKALEKHHKELDRISKLMEEYGLLDPITKKNVDAEVRDYFRNL